MSQQYNSRKLHRVIHVGAAFTTETRSESHARKHPIFQGNPDTFVSGARKKLVVEIGGQWFSFHSPVIKCIINEARFLKLTSPDFKVRMSLRV
jgi:hypothetical protein